MKKLIIVVCFFAGACKFNEKKNGDVNTPVDMQENGMHIRMKKPHTSGLDSSLAGSENTDSSSVVAPGDKKSGNPGFDKGIKDKIKMRDGFVVPFPSSDSVAIH